MTITVEATYEDGVLKPKDPLPLKEREKLRLTIEPELTWAERTAGMIRWTCDEEDLERFAIDPQFDPQESG